jgi:hypothetical protein
MILTAEMKLITVLNAADTIIGAGEGDGGWVAMAEDYA